MKPAKAKMKKFRLETRYPHHRSEGLHPKRARALMAKVCPNGPQIPDAVGRLVGQAFAILPYTPMED